MNLHPLTDFCRIDPPELAPRSGRFLSTATGIEIAQVSGWDDHWCIRWLEADGPAIAMTVDEHDADRLLVALFTRPERARAALETVSPRPEAPITVISHADDIRRRAAELTESLSRLYITDFDPLDDAALDRLDFWLGCISTLTRTARAERRTAIAIAANWPDAIEETAA